MKLIQDDKQMKSELPKWRSYRTMRKLIDDGSWRPGERILGEEHLAKKLGVSRMTARSALEILEDEGLIEGLGRKGRFVADKLKVAPGIFTGSVVLITSSSEIIGPSIYDGMIHAIDSGIIHGANEAKLPFMILPQSNFEHFGGKSLIRSHPAGVAVTDELKINDIILKEIDIAAKGDVPVVVSNYSDALSGYDRVLADQEAGASELVKHLLGLGCRRILQLLPKIEGMFWINQRLSGFRKALKTAGMRNGMEFLHSHDVKRASTPEEFEEQSRRFVGVLVEFLSSPSKVDAIMTTNDVEAFYVAGACRLFGRTPGKDIMIVGFDNMWKDCQESRLIDFRPMATIDKKNHETGLKILEVMLARKNGQLPIGPQTFTIEPKLVIP